MLETFRRILGRSRRSPPWPHASSRDLHFWVCRQNRFGDARVHRQHFALDNTLSSASPAATSAAAKPAYPLKATANNRYLVDQDNVPFLIVDDSPQALVGTLTQEQTATFTQTG
jgi:hypothetical protein